MKLKTGDIIMVGASEWTDLFTIFRMRTWWTHAAMYFGNGKTAEMTDKNFRQLTFKKRYKGKTMRIVRFRWLRASQRKALRTAALKLSNHRFDRLRMIVPITPKREKAVWCTEFIDMVYRMATRVPINTLKIMRGDKRYLDFLKVEVVYDNREGRK